MTKHFYRTNQTSALTSLNLAVGGLLSITALSAVILSSVYVSADSSSADASVTVPEACTMTSTVDTTHTASIDPGTYKSDGIGQTTISTTCNDTSGYAIYAIGYTGDEYTGTNHTKLVGANTNTTIATGTTHTGDTSYWSMKLATGTNAPIIDNSYNDYNVVPDTYTKVAHKTSATGSTASTITTTYAAYISNSQVADSYSGKVKYALVHPNNEAPAQPVACEPSRICYQPNASTVTGQMGSKYATNGASVILHAPNFKRAGYGFAGWNTAFDYSGTYYGPNETITAPSDVETNGLSLYAVWVKSAGTIQNWTGCSNLASGAVTALTDSRDGNTYAVAKLADGKCWMIENLKLADKDGNNNDIDLSSSNTHSPSLPLTNVYDTSSTSNHLSSTSSVAYDATTAPEGWCITSSSACDDQSRLRTDNTVLFTNNTSSNYNVANEVYSYGNYYNWYSATAGHGKYGVSYGANYTAPGDVCPVGWHLPKGGDKSQEATNEYWQLLVTGINNGVNPANYDSTTQPYYTGSTEGAAASNALRSYPNNFIYSGYVEGASVGGRGYNGYYWSASGLSNNYAYYMFFNSNNAQPGTDGSLKYFGRAIRCIADA